MLESILAITPERIAIPIVPHPDSMLSTRKISRKILVYTPRMQSVYPG